MEINPFVLLKCQDDGSYIVTKQSKQHKYVNCRKVNNPKLLYELLLLFRSKPIYTTMCNKNTPYVLYKKNNRKKIIKISTCNDNNYDMIDGSSLLKVLDVNLCQK